MLVVFVEFCELGEGFGDLVVVDGLLEFVSDVLFYLFEEGGEFEILGLFVVLD